MSPVPSGNWSELDVCLSHVPDLDAQLARRGGAVAYLLGPALQAGVRLPRSAPSMTATQALLFVLLYTPGVPCLDGIVACQK